MAIGAAPDMPTALCFRPCHSHTSKTQLTNAGVEAPRGGGGERERGEMKGLPGPSIYSLSLEKTVQQADLLPHLPPGSLAGMGAFGQDSEGTDGLGRGKMKSQQLKEEISG